MIVYDGYNMSYIESDNIQGAVLIMGKLQTQNNLFVKQQKQTYSCNKISYGSTLETCMLYVVRIRIPTSKINIDRYHAGHQLLGDEQGIPYNRVKTTMRSR